MPVAHAEVHRQIQSAGRQVRPQAFHLTTRDGGERRHAAEVFVMLCDRLNALGRDAAASEHVREKRPHVAHTFGAAEGDDEHRVEGPPCHATTPNLRRITSPRY